MYASSSGQLDEFLQIVKKRKWQILIPAVFIFCLSVVVAIVIPQKYHAEAEFELDACYGAYVDLYGRVIGRSLVRNGVEG